MKQLVITAVLFLLIGCAHRARTAPPAGPKTVVEVVPPKDDAEQRLSKVLKASTLSFGFDDATLSEQARASLQVVAAELRQQPWAFVRIVGHCDERGTEEYNIALGQRRAEAAKSYLVTLGVDPVALETVSFGAFQPASDGHDEDAWAQNRRDELEPVELSSLANATP